MISVEDLRKWADEHATGRSPTYPRGWIHESDLRMLLVQVEQNESLNFWMKRNTEVNQNADI